ncbi:MAG TPA: DUF5715 family protein [Terriglobales bacterium]
MRGFICTVAVLFFASGMQAGSRTLLLADITSQVIQNTRADADNLSRMRDVPMVRHFARSGYLVRVSASTRSYYLHDIPSQFHYCRPWTKLFLDRLSREFRAKFKQRLRVTSLIRTVARQKKLARSNGNAADAFGALRSSHLTGATLDISKHGMSPEARSWMRDVLYSLRKQGYLYAIEEFQEPTFHVMVYSNYPVYVKQITRQADDAEVASR